MYGTLNKRSLFLNKLLEEGDQKKKPVHTAPIFIQIHQTVFFIFILWVFVFFFTVFWCSHITARADMSVILSCTRACVHVVIVLYLELVAHGTLSSVKMVGDTPTEMRQGTDQEKKRVNGQAGWELRKKKKKKPVSGLIVPLMSLQAVTPVCGTPHYPSVRVR